MGRLSITQNLIVIFLKRNNSSMVQNPRLITGHVPVRIGFVPLDMRNKICSGGAMVDTVDLKSAAKAYGFESRPEYKTKMSYNQPMSGDGKISTEYTFWCGLCVRWDQLPSEGSKKLTIVEARRAGWKLTKENGWICPKCKQIK